MYESLKAVISELGIPIFLFVIVLIWSAIWKLLALWKAARNNSPAWFIILALVNTLGILEILYVFVFSECCKKKPKQRQRARRRRR